MRKRKVNSFYSLSARMFRHKKKGKREQDSGRERGKNFRVEFDGTPSHVDGYSVPSPYALRRGTRKNRKRRGGKGGNSTKRGFNLQSKKKIGNGNIDLRRISWKRDRDSNWGADKKEGGGGRNLYGKHGGTDKNH